MTTIPTTMNAIVAEGTKTVFKSGVPVPKLEKGFVLIKTEAVAGNPTDWKHADYNFAPEGSISGCDAAGTVVKLGEGVDTTRFAVGDFVYGFIQGAAIYDPHNGAFAEYVAIDQATLFKSYKPLTHSNLKNIPFGNVTTFESAASVPLSMITAGASLFYDFKLKFEWEPKHVQVSQATLIWGGATALGQALIQLMKQINAYTDIVVVASKKHESKLKELGATDIFDYHDSDVIEQITKKYPDLQQLYDTVSTVETTNQTYQCASKTHPAQVLQYMGRTNKDVDAKILRDNVEVTSTIIYNVADHDLEVFGMSVPANALYRNTVAEFVKFVEPRLNDGHIKHIDITVYSNGLKDVPQLLDDIKNNKNSGSKLVAPVK